MKYSLPQNTKNILASKYDLYLPSENTLLEEMKKELIEFQEKQENGKDNKS